MRSVHFRFRILSFFVLLILFAQFSASQGLSVGLKGGAALSNDFERVTGGDSESKQYIFGPAIEVKLPARLAVEASALYRRVGYTSIQSTLIGPSWDRVRANSWEVPFSLKFYFPAAKSVQPFMFGGYALRSLSGSEDNYSYPTSKTGSPGYDTIYGKSEAQIWSNPTHGVTFGGGIRLGSGTFDVSPEIRYTYWSGVPFDISSSHGFSVKSSSYELNFLLKVGFDIRDGARR